MNHFLASLALIGASLVFGSSAIAQDTHDKSAAGDKSVTVTGCLAQGDEANEYSIRDANGKIYGLKSSSVNLKPHLGHQVSITGTPMKEEGSSKRSTESKTGKAEESEHLRVSDLKMISSSCQQ